MQQRCIYCIFVKARPLNVGHLPGISPQSTDPERGSTFLAFNKQSKATNWWPYLFYVCVKNLLILLFLK